MSSRDLWWRRLLEAALIVGIVNADTSGEYLQKAMIDLQQFNVPASYSAQEFHRYSNPLAATEEQEEQEEQEVQEEQQQRQQEQQRIQVQVQVQERERERERDRDRDREREQQQQQQQHGQRRTGLQGNLFGGLPNGERIVLTTEDLAKMYKSALTSGTAMSASSLRNALSSGSGPRFKGNHVEFVLEQGEEQQLHRQPAYRYYFFPLESFASGFSRDHLHKSIQQQQQQQQLQQPQQPQQPQHQRPSASDVVQSGSEQSAQKELANPLFLAISSFVGMALLFMTGVLFLPKLGKLGGFEGRHLQDDFLRLTSAVLNASEQQAKSGTESRAEERQIGGWPRAPYSKKRARGSRSRLDMGHHVNYQG